MGDIRQRKPGRTRPDSDAIPDATKPASALARAIAPAVPTREPYPLYFPTFSILFRLILIARLLAATSSPIADCDETFNYWEPAHYLHYGRGLQTWEYSPDYAIRSWAYVALHAGVAWAFGWAAKSKRHVFILVRVLLGVCSAYAETSLCVAVARHWNARMARYLVAILVFGTGIFISATAFLPSTFAMYTTLMATAASLQPPSTSRTIETVAWYAVGVILGWPFSGLGVVPFVVEDVLTDVHRLGLPAGVAQAVRRLALAGGVVVIGILLPTLLIDSAFYRRPVFASLNLVLYNVFSGPGKGPDVFGTEPWWFYAVNLALNWNVAFALAVLAVPFTLLATYLPQPARAPNDPPITATPTTILRLADFPMWFLVFSAQAHKEERFMYIAYPGLVLCAAAALCCIGDVLRAVGSSKPMRRLAPLFSLSVPALLVVFSVASLSRSVALHLHYAAPLSVYAQLHDILAERISHLGTERANTTTALVVCVGKEWYRFPSHYFVPDGAQLAFLRSGFRGLLPKYFELDVMAAERDALGWRPGTWLTPTGMNDVNREELDRYVDAATCDYVVDFASHAATKVGKEGGGGGGGAGGDHDYCNAAGFRRVISARFLNAGATQGTAARIAWVPGLTRGKRWGEYCAMERVV
ncbi:glycosyltransferase family 22 protein [Gonapodya prolifera JEL478]|uniref:Mannosyltransferase n=1 Tax=Gonapodya prolifera (strain JEL478) TaxID=1344416 RepID=A0A139AA42_GONPJ|nr:glycosyltransferase family 22 protein [Gonapodya prolifera JEL478]|eukprot:KXS13524.1 glycosyltransferase family 22 protein [Gonapodya prolifera JEL478]